MQKRLSAKFNFMFLTVSAAVFAFELSAQPVQNSKNQKSQNQNQQANQISKPLRYDIYDGTDVLAIPSDSSAWDQEEELEDLKQEEQDIQQKKQQNKSR